MSGERSPAGTGGAGAPSPVALFAIPPASAAVVPWRIGGSLRATVVVKAAFVIVPEGPMTPAQPEEILRAEAHHGNSVARSVRLTPDTAPRLPRADVVLTGHACAPEGQTAQWVPVRLALFRDAPLLDKTIYVYGDEGGTVPFDRIPLVYERAYGGLGFADNPLGTGTLELSSKPNLVHPERANRVSCFAPIGKTWPSRRRLVPSGEHRKALEAPIPEIPEGFDWSYFQAAPADQRVDQLRGDEWLVLEGMSPTLLRLRSRLPSARAVAVVYGLPGAPAGTPVELVADTLRIDADRMGCSLVWRGDIAIPSEEALADLRVVAGVDMEGLPIQWPDPAQAAQRQAIEAAPTEELIELDADVLVPLSTATIDTGGEEKPAPPIVPFVPQPPAPIEPSDTPAPRLERAATLVLSGVDPASTMGPPNIGVAAAVPFVPGTAELPPRTSPVVLPGERFGDTLAISPDLLQPPPSLPFMQARTVPPPRWTPVPPPPDALPPMPPHVEDEEPAPAAVTMGGEPPYPSARPVRARASVTTAQGIRIDNETALAVGVVPWALPTPRDCVTVIAKATCDLVPGEPAKLRAAAEALTRDVFAEDADGRVCLYPGDFAPFKVRADVVAIGHAHAPGGEVTSMEVSLRFGEGGNAFERTLLVFGDRRWARGPASAEISEPLPFALMPLTWARAFGGPGFAANPAGVGLVDRWRHARSLPPLANLEDPGARVRVPSQRPAPACFAPLPLSWKQRVLSAERRAPWPRFPEEIDWTSNQIAPRPQQLAFLRGDETFALAGMHRAHATLEGALPGIAPRCFASRPGDRFDEVAMRLDTVVLDADAMKLSLVWRGVLTVADEAKPDVTAVHVVVEKVGEDGMTLGAARARFQG